MKNLEIPEATLTELRSIDGLFFDEKKVWLDFEQIKKFRRAKKANFIVAIFDGEIVGCILLAHEPTFTRNYDGQKWRELNFVITDFCVKKEFRSRGIGEKMLQFCVALAKKEKASSLRINFTDLKNKNGKRNPARKFYERFAIEEKACYRFWKNDK